MVGTGQHLCGRQKSMFERQRVGGLGERASEREGVLCQADSRSEENLKPQDFEQNKACSNCEPGSVGKTDQKNTWVVVKIMVPFWFPILARHPGYPKRDHNFDN